MKIILLCQFHSRTIDCILSNANEHTTLPTPILSAMRTAHMDDAKEVSSTSKFALYPLSAFDVLFERTTFVTGWLVEGTLDNAALAQALKRVTEKWRMLAGRLVSRKTDEVCDSGFYSSYS